MVRDVSNRLGCLQSIPFIGLVWRRAVPTPYIRDPHKDEKMAVIRKALNECSAESPVF
ncbi:hypothetical protein AI2623V1_4911 [Klebsiella oxytoca]|nr:hypothetical protein AI2623V1_4911 [Klebsiella oxytoca]CAH5359217.1 hypothetical protein AI2623V1_4911 [Klebsiella oxytoca]